MTPNPAVTVHLVIHNGASWLRSILDPLMAQTYSNVRVLLLDSASTDGTGDIVKTEYPSIRYVRKEENIGIWAGQEELLRLDDAPYVLVLTDVVLDRSFIERAVRAMEAAPDAGAAQAKIYRSDMTTDGTRTNTHIIDTVGFRISRSFHVTNLGHGESDTGQYDSMREVFAVEGAAPFFRRAALEDCRIDGRLIDPDYRVGGIGYGDDVDVAWRLRLFGYPHIFVPDMIGWHDRSTTKSTASSLFQRRRARIRARKRIPLSKRRLDWSNVRFTIIKNAFGGSLLKFAYRIIPREAAVAGYTLLFEPAMFKESLRFLQLLPTMLKRRQTVMSRARASRTEMERWLT